MAPIDHQSKKETIKSKLDDLNNKLAKEMIGCTFKLEPEQFSPEVSVKHYHTSSKKVTFRCKMKQIPANSNDATTGHKLQGMSKDAIIVLSWPTGSFAAMFKNWKYVILSRVQLTSYMDKIRKFEKDMLEKRKQAITKTFS